MDWDTYKQLCDTPDVMSRWMLEQTIELLDLGCRPLLEAVLVGQPVPKPTDHRGGAATDMFRLDLAREAVLMIHEQVAQAVLTGRTTSATRDRGLGGFEEAWREFVQHLEKADVL